VQTKPTPGARPVTLASKPAEEQAEEDEKATSPVDDAFAKLMNIE
jgi:hypothetical protein